MRITLLMILLFPLWTLATMSVFLAKILGWTLFPLVMAAHHDNNNGMPLAHEAAVTGPICGNLCCYNSSWWRNQPSLWCSGMAFIRPLPMDCYYAFSYAGSGLLFL